jgi:hypothetical protein
MKGRILLEDHPPGQGDMLLLLVLPFAIAVLAGITLSVILW